MPARGPREALKSTLFVGELLVVLGTIVGAAYVSLVWVPSVQPPHKATILLNVYCSRYTSCDNVVIDIVHDHGREQWKGSVPPGDAERTDFEITWQGPACLQFTVEQVSPAGGVVRRGELCDASFQEVVVQIYR